MRALVFHVHVTQTHVRVRAGLMCVLRVAVQFFMGDISEWITSRRHPSSSDVRDGGARLGHPIVGFVHPRNIPTDFL
jgi:hypothetical protein